MHTPTKLKWVGNSKMSEKKLIGRNVAIALGIICIILAASLVVVIVNYTTGKDATISSLNSQIADKDNTISSLNSQIADKDSQIASKDNTISSLNSQITTKNNTISSLNSQISNLQTWLNGNKTLLASTITQRDQLQLWLSGNITSYRNQINSLNSQISSLNAQVTSLTNQVNTLTAIINLAESTIWVNSQTISQPASSYTYWTVSASYAGYVSVTVESSTTTNTYVEVIWSAYGVSYDNTITVGTSGTAVFPVLPASIEIRVGNTNLINGATETVTITYYY
jgi:septal ring factor EnvC (AmiA/AmiB activator)